MLMVFWSHWMLRRRCLFPAPSSNHRPGSGSHVELCAAHSTLLASAFTEHAVASSTASPARSKPHTRPSEAPSTLSRPLEVQVYLPLPPPSQPAHPTPQPLPLHQPLLSPPRLQRPQPTMPSPSPVSTLATCCCHWPSTCSSWRAPRPRKSGTTGGFKWMWL